MTVSAPTPITPGPSVPSSTDPQDTFDAMFEASLTWQRDQLQPGANALAQNVYQNALETQTNADEATADAANAAASQAAAAASQAAAASSASSASASASAAAGSAGAANTSAVNAASSASAANTSATNAASSATAAQAARDQAQIFATQQLKASSTTSLTPGAGNKTFTIEAGRSFVAGMYLVVTSSGAPSNKMSGYVVSYDSPTGVLVLAVDAVSGSTVRADWVIGVAAPGSSASGLTRQEVNTNTTCLAGVAYVITAANITLTLPTSWATDDRIAFVEAIGNGTQYTLAFGSTPLRGRAVGAQVISSAYGASGVLTYQNSTRGLV